MNADGRRTEDALELLSAPAECSRLAVTIIFICFATSPDAVVISRIACDCSFRALVTCSDC